MALIEQSDFAKGTSSRSTKLVHGGVRYLRQGNLSLVRESLRERTRLTRNAPHLVRPLPFVIPAYHWWTRPYYGLGLRLYDGLAGADRLGRSRGLSRQETLEYLPTIAPGGLCGGVVYGDAQFDDARLALHLALTAADQGAVVVNHVRCIGLRRQQGRLEGVQVRDEETGREFPVRARGVINATGIFVDMVRELDTPKLPPLVAVSSGVHLVLPAEFLPGPAALMVPKTADGRVLFAVPWQGRVIVGTTDTRRSEPEIEPRALAGERRFVLEHARRYLSKDLTETDVLSIFTGLRPLVRQNGTGGTAGWSRDHTMVVSASGLVSVTGGKWTTYRQMAEDVMDRAEKVAQMPHRPSPTRDLRLHGWAPASGATPTGHWDAYGSDAAGVRAICGGRPEWSEPLHPRLPWLAGEVVWQVKSEMARTVDDVLARRMRALLWDAAAAIEMAPRVAALLAAVLHRDENWQRSQVDTFRAMARRYVFTDPASVEPDLE